MRGGGGGDEVGSAEGEGRRTTPGEGTLQEGGGAHARLTRARRRQVAKGLGRAAQPVPALTCVPTDVRTVDQNQANVCLCGSTLYPASSAQYDAVMNISHCIHSMKFMIVVSDLKWWIPEILRLLLH